MATPSERRALLFLAGLVLLGAGVRGVRAGRREPADEASREALRRQIALVDSIRAAGGRRRSARGAPSRSSASGRPDRAPIDLDRAPAESIALLPRLGRSLAQRIAANRDTFGPFGSLDALRQRVRGIGEGRARTLAPAVTFSLPQRPLREAAGDDNLATARSLRRRLRRPPAQ